MTIDEKTNRDLFREISVEEENTGKPLMEKPFNPSLINIDVKSPTISNLIDRLKQTPPEIDLYADFQRRDDLWMKKNKAVLLNQY